MLTMEIERSPVSPVWLEKCVQYNTYNSFLGTLFRDINNSHSNQTKQQQ